MTAFDVELGRASPTSAAPVPGSMRWSRLLAGAGVRKFSATHRAYATAGFASNAHDLNALVAANACFTARYYRRMFALLDRRERTRMHAEVDASGVALLERALDGGRGAIIVTAHLGEFDLAASWLAQVRGLRIVVPVARVDPLRQLLFNRVRREAGLRLVAARATAARRLRDELKENAVVVLMLDRRPPAGGHSSTFFGRASAIARTPVLLSLRSGAPLITGATHTVGRSLVLSFASLASAGTFAAGGSPALDALTRALIADVERLVAAHPEQWHVPADLAQLPWLNARAARAVDGMHDPVPAP